MIRSLLSIACHAYGAAAVVYLVYLVRQSRVLALTGRSLVAFGLLLHGATLIMLLDGQGGVPQGMGQGLSVVAFLLLSIFLIIDVGYRRPVFGAFVTPLALMVLVPAFLVSSEVPMLSAELRGPLLPVHVAIALLGLASFAVAAGVGGMYLLMERQVKGKRFGLLFSRLPPLQLLDELNRRLVLFGFIALSITLATGAFFVTGASGLEWQWAPKEVTTVVAWVVFAALLQARFFAGWQGKRVAVLTMAGFGILIVSFLSAFDPAAISGGMR
jgi:ABC-type uncharacterized transport system permease subunit